MYFYLNVLFLDVQLGAVLQVIYDQGVWKEKIKKLGELGDMELIEVTFKDWISGIKVSEEYYSDATFFEGVDNESSFP